MPRRKSDIPLRKHTLNLFDGQVERLQELHGRVGAGRVIRELIHNHIKKVDGRASKKVQALDLEPIA